jgi:hypothetical protein
MTASVQAVASVPGLRVVAVNGLSMVMDCSPYSFAGPLPGSRNAMATTSLNFVTLRYKGTDGDRLMLADQDTNSYLHVSRPVVVPGDRGVRTHEIVGAIEDAHSDAMPVITHVVIRAMGFMQHDPGIWTIANVRVEYGSPPQTASVSGFPDYSDTDHDPATAYATASTGEIVERPGGGAWTWPDVLNLGDLHFKLETTCTELGAIFEWWVNECWAEVYGPIGSFPGGTLILRQRIGGPLGPPQQTESALGGQQSLGAITLVQSVDRSFGR